MNILIIEDETLTADRLAGLIKEFDPELNIIGQVDSVESSIEWFENNKAPDLIFQDIELSDGNCFEIYDQVKVDVPIIFTTAYSEYALKSFQLNSIDYVLKPYDKKDIKRVLEKFLKYKNLFFTTEQEGLKKVASPSSQNYKSRFMISIGDQFKSIKTEEVSYIKYEEGLSFLHLFDSTSRFPVDKSISTLEDELDPTSFFRVNRKYIIHINSISKINTWFNSRLQIDIGTDDEIIVSRDRVKAFKEWLDQ
ncbi:LytTR family transcriptional regulator DNA-binding domain-containing protein [Flammeovirga yaeyamensis]|uniref:LytTR family transcriptional regulator DNA-binding domain-containing protein n=1 Tax=Flammeovirga yaeyamensis TaxID=367791 RepID=A0AAX1N156_9BACT|nr:LytTR family DNA-binding domain-containing protein [Flammeovirga yaeyamensis]MBB3698418.1 DNA-binding LytR/AlgR family response regulator [Flammeovirga yaeyamensis]NMF34232.1 response regulator transcription factor [Flammeovirga yaeyamensis]QWG01216.1 LytTR family transcriptional regulator DNA-binding domain-containing protein [Flammeovirga yaeyamensis]